MSTCISNCLGLMQPIQGCGLRTPLPRVGLSESANPGLNDPIPLELLAGCRCTAGESPGAKGRVQVDFNRPRRNEMLQYCCTLVAVNVALYLIEAQRCSGCCSLLRLYTFNACRMLGKG